MEKLRTQCPHCRKTIVYERRHAGRKVGCPACREQVILSAADVASALVIDPFAELADDSRTNDLSTPATSKPASQSGASKKGEPNSNASKVNTIETRVESTKKTDSSAPPARSDSTQHAETASSRISEVETSRDHEQNSRKRSEDQADPGDAATFGEPFDEPYIDEFGLADLDLNETETQSQSALPPVSKNFVRKKPRRSEGAESKSEVSSGSPSKSSPREKVATTSFRSDNHAPMRSRRRIYVILLMTLLPLLFSMIMRDRKSMERGVAAADEPQADAEPKNNGEQPLFDEPDEDAQDQAWEEPPAEVEPEFVVVDDFNDLFDHFPGKRFEGALLARDSAVHWIFAALSGIGFFAMFSILFRNTGSPRSTAMFAALFTAAVGLVMLMAFEKAAFSTTGFWLRGRSIVALVFLVIKFFGFSYRCALQEGNGFILSFFAFTCGVAVCEAICRMLPVIGYLGKSENASWQGACLVGLASGVGFGIAEGITYSATFYNGMATADTYLVRFVSCVALHAVWSGAGAVMLYFNQDGLHGGFSFIDFIFTMLMTQGISIVLHGLYDTLLKQQFLMMALLVGVASVGWLIYVLERLASDEQPSEVRMA